VASRSSSKVAELVKARRWLFKFGSALVTDDGRGLHNQRILSWCRVIAAHQKARQLEVAFVSSGAVAEGIARLGLKKRPRLLRKLQAVAAIGQAGVMKAYETALKSEGLVAASLLLTRQDLSDRQSYLNARATLTTLIGMKVIPVINENDTVATEEIRFGDNDFLAALVANLIEADVLVLVTDQKGFYKKDPRVEPNAEFIDRAEALDASLDQYAGSGGAIGRGGMKSKLQAARQAALGGAITVICDGRSPAALEQLLAGNCSGTLIYPNDTKLAARKRWLSFQSDASGCLLLDDGAVRVLQAAGSSLLPVGVVAVEGEFSRGALVSCRSATGVEVAKGLSNYSSDEARLIAGCRSDMLEKKLGYAGDREIIHRDNLVITRSGTGQFTGS